MKNDRALEIQRRLQIPDRVSEGKLTQLGELGRIAGYDFWEVCEAVWAKVAAQEPEKGGI